MQAHGNYIVIGWLYCKKLSEVIFDQINALMMYVNEHIIYKI